jgi:hypothetical protein
MIDDPRPVGVVLLVAGAIGVLASALADVIGYGVNGFGWLQTTGVILGAVVALVGLALGMEWVPPLARRRAARDAGAAGGSPQTTVVKD